MPYLLGFHPENSLVVVFHGAGGESEAVRRSTVAMTARSDLPDPEHDDLIASQLVSTLQGCEPDRRPAWATLVVVGGGGSSSPPRRDLVDVVTRCLAEAAVTVAHALWAEATSRDARWRCYQDETCHGRVADPGCSVAAATFAAEGTVTYRSREELTRVCEPRDPSALVRRSQLLDGLTDEGIAPVASPPASFAVVCEALDAAATGHLELTDDDVVRLAVALSERQVRDAFLITDDSAAAARLWLALTRETPEPERAEPACLLACTAYLRGEGALAGVALDTALAADPGHTLAALLRTAQQSGVPPNTVREYLRRAVADAGTNLARPGGSSAAG